MTRREAIREMRSRGDQVVMAGFANEIAQAFGHTAQGLDVVYKCEVGIDMGRRVEYVKSGEAVDICSLAMALAEECNAPDVEYKTDYLGAGKRARALTERACRRLEALRLTRLLAAKEDRERGSDVPASPGGGD